MMSQPRTAREMQSSFMTLTVWCSDCRHSQQLDLDKLPQDRDPTSLRFYCSQCYSRKHSFIVGVDHPRMMDARMKR